MNKIWFRTTFQNGGRSEIFLALEVTYQNLTEWIKRFDSLKVCWKLKDGYEKFGNYRNFPKNSKWFDSQGISNFILAIDKLIPFLAGSIGYLLLILCEDLFSTKLNFDQKKSQLVGKQLDL